MTHATHKMSFISNPIRVVLQARWLFLICLVTPLLTLFGNAALSQTYPVSSQQADIKGYVYGERGPITGATVRIQASPIFTMTDSTGYFTLPLIEGEDTAVLTAWAPGYYIGGGIEYRPGDYEIVIRLERHCEKDHNEYKWVSAFSEISKEKACQTCHAEPGNRDSELPFDQWRKDGHAGSVRNKRFLTMYLGTDVHGNRSAPTRYKEDRDYGRTPILPSTRQPYHGPGYKLDFPTTAGNCAACHAPMAAVYNPYGVDPSLLTGVMAEGINCDFCHKVWDVTLDPDTGLPFDNRPGVLSFLFRRPEPGRQLFTGPLDDVAPGEDVFSPVQKQSRYCAPCHSAKFWGVEIYNSYGEWLDSPYALPESETTCQDCHMPRGLTDHFARLEEGGKRRDPKTIFAHRMLGAGDANLLRNAVTMTVGTELRDSTLEVRIEIRNDRSGHHVPTDSPLRQMILIVRASDPHGVALDHRSGPALPDWCGVGDPDEGYVAGLPGTGYAKILEELWTGVSPTGAYWNQTRIRSDNRIAAMNSDETTYVFETPTDDDVIVDVRLLYRRAFIQLRDVKGWDGEDIEMARQTITVGRNRGARAGLAESVKEGRNDE
jgi:mono/diheme cytochrome c family protein